MNGNNLLLDTNIVLYFLNGDKTLIPILEDKSLFISFITQLELLSYNELSSEEIESIQLFLNECTIIDININIKNIAIDLRKKYHLKLPDSIIIATAIWLNSPVISSDMEFARAIEADIILYER
jgi:predicted nucleic acid-binding protein